MEGEENQRALKLRNSSEGDRPILSLAVSRFVKFQKPRPAGNSVVFGASTDHRKWYPCIKYKDTYYVFTGTETSVDAEVFNNVVSSLGITIGNEKDAMNLAEVFLDITDGKPERRDSRVIAKPSDINFPDRRTNSETARIEQILTQPAVKLEYGKYVVDLFYFELPSAIVSKWTFMISPSAFIRVERTALLKFD